MRKLDSVVLGTIGSLAAGPALASGFASYENGAKASAQGGAWVARADDASANWYNPAALVHVAGGEVQFGFNYLDIGSNTQFSPSPGVSFEAWGHTRAIHFKWNYFKSLDIETGSPATSIKLTENWTGTWSYRLGFAVRLGQEIHHELRAGGVFDESPIPTAPAILSATAISRRHGESTCTRCT